MAFLKKNEYLNCHFMKHSLHFFQDSIKACCTNAQGPVFYPDYSGEVIDWNYIFNIRKKYIKNINSFWNKKTIPDCCKNCSELNLYKSKDKVKKFENIIDTVYFHHSMSCNAKCVYCCYRERSKGYNYKVLPAVKSLIDNKILSKHASIYMSGGEITINPEFEELLYLLINYLDSKIEILTSGIKYCKSIESAFKADRCILIISPDCADRETYKKIKRVDCFDELVNNLKTYISACENAKNNIILKYIIVDNINDNNEEIEKFINLAKNLGVKNVRMDIDYEKYNIDNYEAIPQKYYDLILFFNKLAKDANLNVQHCNQVDFILSKRTKS